MDRFVIQKTILSYFTGDSGLPTIHPPAAIAAETAPHAEVIASQQYTIFCDGACTKNGKRGARAAYGLCIWRGATETAAVSQPLRPEEPQTNQRAELRALSEAVAHAERLAGSGAPISIHTDSEYAINCITKWAPTWKRAGWMKADKTPVLHRDIIEPLYDRWRGLPVPVRLMHVSAHTGRSDILSRGNARADELASAAL